MFLPTYCIFRIMLISRNIFSEKKRLLPKIMQRRRWNMYSSSNHIKQRAMENKYKHNLNYLLILFTRPPLLFLISCFCLIFLLEFYFPFCFYVWIFLPFSPTSYWPLVKLIMKSIGRYIPFRQLMTQKFRSRT